MTRRTNQEAIGATRVNDARTVVSFEGLTRAGRALKAFAYLYLPFHELPLDTFFSKFGLWSCVEALAYEADELNEQGSLGGRAKAALKPIERLLKSESLLDPECREQLANARKYFAFERRYRSGLAYNVSDVLQAAAWRSFDFRLLHRLLWRAEGWPYVEGVFEAFRPFEELIEFDDDRGSVEKDRGARTFNVCVALSKVRGNPVERYVRRLGQRVATARNRMGRRYEAMLQKYRSLVPETVLPDD